MIASSAPETVLIYRVYIKASPEAVWEAITKPEWTVRYGYAPLVEYDLRAGGAFRAYPNEGMKAFGCPDVISDGEVLEAVPPRKLVQTWRMTMTSELAAEAFTTLTYEIEPVRGGVSRLTVTHDVTGAPMWAAVARGEHESDGAGGGWNEILSGLKTLLETGEPLPFQSGPEEVGAVSDVEDAFGLAVSAFVDAVAGISDDDWDEPGLGEWDVRALVGHSTRALLTVETYLATGTGSPTFTDPVDYYLAVLGDPADPSDADRRTALDAAVAERGRQAGAELGADPAGRVAEIARRVVALVRSTEPDAPLATPAGTMTLQAYLPTRIFELAVHTLDLHRAIRTDPAPQLEPAIALTWELLGRIASRRQRQGDLVLCLAGRRVTLAPIL